MSEQLVVAETTLKRHVSNLYLKLEVHSRTQALARAADLKLL
jgi:LuxR family maltose regulon positive regulatory protein